MIRTIAAVLPRPSVTKARVAASRLIPQAPAVAAT